MYCMSYMLCVIRSLRMWIEDHKKNFKYSIITTSVTMGHTTTSRSNTTLVPPSYHISPGVVVMAGSVPHTGNVSVPSVDYSVSDIVFNQQPARQHTHIPPSTVVTARLPLLPYVQPNCFIHTAGNQYMPSTGVYTHQWGAAPLLETPRSQKRPTHPLPPQRNVLLPRQPHHAIPQLPYPYNIQVHQYPIPARPLLHSTPQQGSLHHSNASKSP